jgi:hypothetical protein
MGWAIAILPGQLAAWIRLQYRDVRSHLGEHSLQSFARHQNPGGKLTQ